MPVGDGEASGGGVVQAEKAFKKLFHVLKTFFALSIDIIGP